MAWTCSGRTNAELVLNLFKKGLISSKRVLDTMTKVDRVHYTPINPYNDSPEVIGYNATISAPHMHSYALELLEKHLQPGSSHLDVGCGSGYLTVCMAAMVDNPENKGKVIGIDHIPELVELAKRNAKHDPIGSDLLSRGILEFRLGSGFIGVEGSLFDSIHVGAAAPEIPKTLLSQLKVGGRMVIPVGPEGGDQYLLQVDKHEDGNITTKNITGVRYIPLTSPSHQLKKY
eukprot:TRINITY_DN1155_c0_g1_i2.p1 TRINITY_DN1155_c0_g1~~TRINITY_DN1155_c0_g1_i2.p1  ORF type:complete len:231 (-),score=39.91 TRINITY_DN1155_c0_g1_i2:98-790(-)